MRKIESVDNFYEPMSECSKIESISAFEGEKTHGNTPEQGFQMVAHRPHPSLEGFPAQLLLPSIVFAAVMTGIS